MSFDAYVGFAVGFVLDGFVHVRRVFSVTHMSVEILFFREGQKGYHPPYLSSQI
jgi:hypothetical protein